MKQVAGTIAVAIIAGSAWLNWRWLEHPMDISPIAQPAREAAAVQQAEAGKAALGLTLDASQTLARPIFHPDRKPFVAPPLPVEPPPPVVEPAPEAEPVIAAPVVQAAPPPEIKVSGISLSTSRKRALLGRVSGDDAKWYGVGDDLDGWQIVEITGKGVTLESGGQRLVFSLYPTRGT